jgi:hypothetical protein
LGRLIAGEVIQGDWREGNFERLERW